MSAAPDISGEAERQRFVALLDQAGAEGRKLAFWWRDDDAEDATPALGRLLELGKKHGLPLALAVVPKRATEALAERIQGEPQVFVLQHGWRHRNYAREGDKKVELGSERPPDTIIDELARGFDRLRARFPEKFLPVLVPPWNRIADAIRQQRRLAGLIGLSTIGPAEAGEHHSVNVHIDILAWKPPRPIERGEAYAQLCAETERRLEGCAEPIGLMTHHLVQEEPSWALLDEVFGLVAKHPAVSWPPVPRLFGLTPPSA
jgi:peptidoglycan/xylan/chitin deacetylase (PgdA/CDA1 family)